MGLKETTINLLNERRGDWPEIASSVEGISYHWLQKLAQGHINDPGVTRIERLHAYLTASQEAEPGERVA